MTDVVHITEQTTVTVVEPTQVVSITLSGEQGPAGPGLADGVFTQVSAITPWVVNHNLGRKPLVAVFNAGGSEVLAEVVHISNNQFQVLFASPFSGTARFI